MFKNLIKSSCNGVWKNHSVARLIAVPNHQVQWRSYVDSSYIGRDQVAERVISVVKTHEKIDGDKVAESSNFTTDLGLDSLDSTELILQVENEFNIEIPDEEAFNFKSVSDLIEYVSKNPMAK